jgi:hypothetical protein
MLREFPKTGQQHFRHFWNPSLSEKRCRKAMSEVLQQIPWKPPADHELQHQMTRLLRVI